MAIKIPFIADVTSFIRGTKDLHESLDDVADSLDDITKAGARVDVQVGDDLESVGREADESAEKVERSFREAFKAVEAQGRTSSRKVKQDVDEVGERGSSTIREFGSEARQNVAESLSSFTGSASSAVDAVQSTFGGLVSALGPAGLLGAGVVAAGIGMARGLFEKSQEEAERLAERVSAIFGELRDSAGAVSFDFKSEAISQLLDNADDLKAIFGTDDIKAFNRELLALGLAGDQTATLFEGLVGDAADVAAAQALVNEEQEKWTRIVRDSTAAPAARANAREQLELLARFETAYQDSGGAATEAAAKYRIYQRATTDVADATDTAVSAGVAYVGMTQDQAAGAQAAADAITRKNAALEEEAGQNFAVEAALLAYKDALHDTNDAIKENGRTHDVNTEKGRANRKALLDLARAGRDYAAAAQEDSGKVETYNDVIGDQEKAFRDAAKAAGYTHDQVDKLVVKYGLVPKKVKTEVTDDGSAARTQERIDNIKSSGVPVPVTPDMGDFDRKVQQHLNGRTYRVTLAPRAGKAVAT